MKDKIAWVLLAAKCRHERKMKALCKDFDKKKKEVDFTAKEAISLANDIEKAMGKGYKFITYMDKEYPDDLRNITYPPAYLFVRGNIKLLKHPIKATIVGSREASAYGMNTAMNFAMELSQSNVCIVSGGARGIDSAAIRGAVKSGLVIVVIGTGIDIDYPKENSELFEKVCASGGVIVSEFPLGMGPLGQNFPVRNRIMTALGDCSVIVEAAERSGALISASHALEQGKTLFAVPGNIDSPNSVGTNALLRDGALFATSGSDILYELMEKEPDKFRCAQNYFEEEDENEAVSTESKKQDTDEKNLNYLSQYETAVVNAVKTGKDTYEEILNFTQMETNKLTSVLTIMEIKGIIKLAFGNRYKLND